MTPEERTSTIESYGQGYAVLVHALKEFPPEMWHFKPTAEDWSIHETVVHIADSEANSYARVRRCIAEPGQAVMAYDENGWAKALHYTEQSYEEALQLFRWLRNNTYNLIKTLPEETWANTIYHPENGVMTMDDWLQVYERHVPEHVEQMNRVLQAWRSQER